ncbi:P-loop containing nucleoside triphosphate hydrolase protein [Leucosporidium creatinivorum]|uniref:p-loop containing nucleoside triphosphate hydrolase protein n=1 Tax=Leucosporidium creatinivorum TaxID=106004 RepID=A0A1Y2F3E9_9BASI|nr:P-loop containing nucleoside triphosphate hydrolase protein [Leucosporidium creatinivorum]
MSSRGYDPYTTSTTQPHAHSDLSSPPNSTSHTAGSSMSYSSNPTPMPIQRPDAKVKLVCVGDGGVGKTCLLIVYSRRQFPTDYVPTVFENYVLNKPYDSKIIEFALWDTAGQEEYDRLRPLSYPEAQVVFICFAVDFPVSLENIEDKWFPEVSHFCEGVPIILIATKTDLRHDTRALDLLKAQGRHPVTRAEGEAVARKIGARYAEVSAMKGEGVEEVFDLALREAMRNQGGGIGRFVGGGTGGGKRRRVKCVVV